MPHRSNILALPWRYQANLVLLLGALLVLIAILWPHWQENPDLSHGWFMPLIFALLLRENLREPTPRFMPASRIKTAGVCLLLVGSIGAIVMGGLYAASVGWDHALVAFVLTGGVVLLLFAGLLVLSDTQARLIPLHWPVIAAIGLWLLCAPLPPGTYSRLTLNLQLMVTKNVLVALNFLGVAANRQGNIIELANTSVGVAEACSGVRSLISCVFAGLVFSAMLVKQTWARIFLVILAVPLALGMNFLRSLTLTLLANKGVDISGTWHDVTGFAVLGVTAVILGGLAVLFDTSTASVARTPATAPSSSALPNRLSTVLLVSLSCASVIALFFFVVTRSTPAATPPPNLLKLLPAEAAGWHVTTSSDLYEFSGVLKTTNLAERTYRKRVEGQLIQLTVYLAFWQAGQSSISQVAMHTPDACWPGSGWVAQPEDNQRIALPLRDRTLPPAEARKFRSGNYPQNVWFWHLYAGRPISYENPYSAWQLLQTAWHYGFQRSGDQMFVRVSTNVSWTTLQDEPLLNEIFTQLRSEGL